jgi:ParB family chromosome partitioning protein
MAAPMPKPWRRWRATVRHVQGRRLADLAEPIFAALAAGEITLDVAQAYGSTGDRERQAAAWAPVNELAGRQSAGDPPRDCRGSLSADHPIARFLAKPNVACGGRIERDLFAAEGEGRWLDGDLAMDLAAKKLAHEAEVAELGSKLAWVKPTLQPMSPMTRPICTPTGRAAPSPARWPVWTKSPTG